MKACLNPFSRGISLSGAIPLLIGLAKKQKRQIQAEAGALMPLALSVMMYGMFLWFYHLMQTPEFPVWLIALLIISALLGLFANINHVSMHRYYRNRLMEVFFAP